MEIDRKLARTLRVYLVTHRASGKRYVGLTRGSVGHRWGQHRADAKRGVRRPLYNAMRKYGVEAFNVACIAECLSPGRAALTERQLIKALRPEYNLTSGGEGGHVVHASTRAKIKAIALARPPATPETCAKLSAANKGRKHTAETRARVCEAHKGLRPSAETRAKLSAAQTGNTKMLGKKQSPATRQKMAEARRLWWERKRCTV